MPQFTLTDVAGELSAQSLSGPYKVSASYLFAGRPQELRFSTSEPDAAGVFRIKSSLRDLDRNTTYSLDGGVTGLGAKPQFDGAIVVRAATVVAANGTEEGAEAETDEQPAATAPRDKTSRYELKGPITATPERAELPDFDLTIQANGHPQIFKGKLALDFAERISAKAELAAGFVDLDALLAVPGAEERPTPAAVLYMFADEMLGQAAEFGDGTLDLRHRAGGTWRRSGRRRRSRARQQGRCARRSSASRPCSPATIASRPPAALPAASSVRCLSVRSQLDGAKLKPLTRWAVGDRDMSGQASVGEFTFTANATIGDGELKLADASGELSGTKFHGGLRLQGGERRLIEINLDSDRLDLREMIGDGPLWQIVAAVRRRPAARPTPVRACSARSAATTCA